MPPKKAEAPKQPTLIGRFGTSLKIGIVGLPNVGYVLDVYWWRAAPYAVLRVTAQLLTCSSRALSITGNPLFSMCSPKVKLLQKTSHSALLTQTRAGYLSPMIALTSSASTTNQPGECSELMSLCQSVSAVKHSCVPVSSPPRLAL